MLCYGYFCCQFESFFLGEVFNPIFLKEVFHLLAALTEWGCPPFWAGSWGFSLENSGFGVRWESCDQGWDSIGSGSSSLEFKGKDNSGMYLSEFLELFSRVFGNVFDRGIVFVRELIALAVDSGLVGEDSGICV